MLWLLSGVILCWQLPWYSVPHIAAVLWMVSFHLRRGYCILTKLEKDAMTRCGREPYRDGFYQHYLFRIMLGHEVSETFVKKFMITTKVVPGLLPVTYPLIKLIF